MRVSGDVGKHFPRSKYGALKLHNVEAGDALTFVSRQFQRTPRDDAFQDVAIRLVRGKAWNFADNQRLSINRSRLLGAEKFSKGHAFQPNNERKELLKNLIFLVWKREPDPNPAAQVSAAALIATSILIIVTCPILLGLFGIATPAQMRSSPTHRYCTHTSGSCVTPPCQNAAYCQYDGVHCTFEGDPFAHIPSEDRCNSSRKAHMSQTRATFNFVLIQEKTVSATVGSAATYCGGN
ncbi:hypothetical protein TcasGA2_TC010031 [Tribolium castaneum]|uniref:Uncharacterized protein n=1 Tax=Tribolium castaneum TaxID=7070 RepID=D6WRL8_TRICA|nr:hypothetical protein TcasGA2_TC010031 [Tribolium castaneum]